MSEQNIEQRFVKAWGEVENPELDGFNPHFGNRFATLRATIAVIRVACRENGIAYSQRLVRNDMGFAMKSYLSDGSRTFEMSEFPIDTPPNPQSFGSNLTYTKRQQAQADWSITGEEDDDGNAAAEPHKHDKSPKSDKNRFAKIGELKSAAIERGIKESGIKEWLEAKFKGKQMKDFNDPEIRVVEAHLQSLIEDADKLKEEAGA